MASNLADALSALSLLIAAFAVFFGLWQPDVAKALAMEPKRYRVSRNDQVAEARSALWRMIALAGMALLVGLVFLCRAWSIAREAIFVGGDYDDLATAFVVSEILVLGIAVLGAVNAFQVLRLFRMLSAAADILPPAA
jgi:hypothetical protein